MEKILPLTCRCPRCKQSTKQFSPADIAVIIDNIGIQLEEKIKDTTLKAKVMQLLGVNNVENDTTITIEYRVKAIEVKPTIYRYKYKIVGIKLSNVDFTKKALNGISKIYHTVKEKHTPEYIELENLVSSYITSNYKTLATIKVFKDLVSYSFVKGNQFNLTCSSCFFEGYASRWNLIPSKKDKLLFKSMPDAKKLDPFISDARIKWFFNAHAFIKCLPKEKYLVYIPGTRSHFPSYIVHGYTYDYDPKTNTKKLKPEIIERLLHVLIEHWLVTHYIRECVPIYISRTFSPYYKYRYKYIKESYNRPFTTVTSDPPVTYKFIIDYLIQATSVSKHKNISINRMRNINIVDYYNQYPDKIKDLSSVLYSKLIKLVSKYNKIDSIANELKQNPNTLHKYMHELTGLDLVYLQVIFKKSNINLYMDNLDCYPTVRKKLDQLYQTLHKKLSKPLYRKKGINEFNFK